MTKKKQIQLELDYQDTYSDFIRVTEMVNETSRDERQALLKLREILRGTLKVMKEELDANT